jgi:Rod binding domain-containing protein
VSDLSITSLAENSGLNQAQQGQAIRALKGIQSQPTTSEKIDKAARDFESILIGEWLKEAEKSFATVPGVDPDQQSDSGHDQFQSISCQFMAEGLTKAGGLGIAAMISKQLKANHEVQSKSAESQNSATSPDAAK